MAATVLAAPLLLAASPNHGHPSGHDPAKDAATLSRQLVRASSAKDAYRHLQQFQAIADSAGGHRAAGSPGHDASAAYVYEQLRRAFPPFTAVSTAAASAAAPCSAPCSAVSFSYTDSRSTACA